MKIDNGDDSMIGDYDVGDYDVASNRIKKDAYMHVSTISGGSHENPICFT